MLIFDKSMLSKATHPDERRHIRHINCSHECQDLFWCLDGHNVRHLHEREHFLLALSLFYRKEMMG
jgi:hypothetical protein